MRISHARDVLVQIMKTKRIFEIPLHEHLKHTGFKVRVNNKLQTLTLTCALKGHYPNEGSRGSCTCKRSRPLTSDEEEEIEDLAPLRRGRGQSETGHPLR